MSPRFRSACGGALFLAVAAAVALFNFNPRHFDAYADWVGPLFLLVGYAGICAAAAQDLPRMPPSGVDDDDDDGGGGGGGGGCGGGGWEAGAAGGAGGAGAAGEARGGGGGGAMTDPGLPSGGSHFAQRGVIASWVMTDSVVRKVFQPCTRCVRLFQPQACSNLPQACSIQPPLRLDPTSGLISAMFCSLRQPLSTAPKRATLTATYPPPSHLPPPPSSSPPSLRPSPTQPSQARDHRDCRGRRGQRLVGGGDRRQRTLRPQAAHDLAPRLTGNGSAQQLF
jgi:hypothetical protein